jgi:hypothetical protein
MLAMDLSTPRGVRLHALSFTTIASMLAPTGDRGQACNQVGFKAASLLLWLLMFLPHRGDPRSRTEARACRALARHRTPGARALGYLGPGGVPFFQVTRCKSETLSGRYRSNGYVLSHQSPLAARTPSPASLAPTPSG